MNHINRDEHLNIYLRKKGLLPIKFDPSPEKSEVPNSRKDFFIGTPNGIKNVGIDIKSSKKIKQITTPKIKKKKLEIPFFTCNAHIVKEVECSGIRCIAHIITRQYHSISASPDNRIIICKQHETYFNNQPIEVWFHWVKRNFPEKFKAVQKRYEFILAEYRQFMTVAENA